MDVFLARDVPDDAEDTGPFAADALHSVAVPGDERDGRSPFVQRVDQGPPKAGGAPGDRDAQLVRMQFGHVTLLAMKCGANPLGSRGEPGKARPTVDRYVDSGQATS